MVENLSYYIVDVFTHRQFGGNPLAVVLNADGLSTEQMQRIAMEFNLSETSFIKRPSNDDVIADIRIFTPKVELPIAGHPIIGTSDVLMREELISLGENERLNFQVRVKAGNVPVRIQSTNGNLRSIYFSAPLAPEFDNDVPSADNLAQLLNIPTVSILSGRVQRVFHGNWTLVVPVIDRQALSQISIDNSRWDDLLGSCKDDQVYPVYIHQDSMDEVDASVRLFFTAGGIGEDPATGSAAISLAAYMANNDTQFNASYSWKISQGIEFGRPSTINAQATKESGNIVGIRIGGSSVLVAKGELFIR